MMAGRTRRQWAVYYVIYAILVAPWLALIILVIRPWSYLAGWLVEAAVITGGLIGANELEQVERRRRDGRA